MNLNYKISPRDLAPAESCPWGGSASRVGGRAAGARVAAGAMTRGGN